MNTSTSDNHNILHSKADHQGQPSRTEREFRRETAKCRELFSKKLEDYGVSWRVMRPESLTDQIMIKARRIRSLELKGGRSAVDEGVEPEFIGIVNYCAIALMQLELGLCSNLTDIGMDHALVMDMYDRALRSATSLMFDKNHDYDEAWRDMRVSSFTDIVLQKILRTKEIENHGGKTLVSEGVAANYMDMINYSLFALIKLNGNESSHASE